MRGGGRAFMAARVALVHQPMGGMEHERLLHSQAGGNKGPHPALHRPRPYGKWAQHAAPYTSYMRESMVSLIVRIVKYHVKSTDTCIGTCDSCTHHSADRRRSKPSGCLLLASKLLTASLHEAGASRDEFTNDHIFLEAYQVIGLSLNRRLCQHARRFLEGSSGQEAIGIEGRLSNAQQHGLCCCRLAAFGQNTGIGVCIDETIDQIIR